jgi:membrane-associated phospholipid phosphatase
LTTKRFISGDHFAALLALQLIKRFVVKTVVLFQPDHIRTRLFETGFAFPSGHTMFAASWALLAIGLLWPRRHYKTASASRVSGSHPQLTR